MEIFLWVAGLALLFVLGPVLAMRPSPRQSQLARLRTRALGCGLRVRVSAAAARAGEAEYVLAWRLEDLDSVRLLRFGARRGAFPGWELSGDANPENPAMLAALGGFPATVTELRAVDEGLAATWTEKGRDDEVDRIAAALVGLREVLVGATCGP